MSAIIPEPGVTTAQLAAVDAKIPAAATGAPPAIADSSTEGAQGRYAREDHTHASKLRKARMQTGTDGTVVWTFSPAFPVGTVPRVTALAETAVGVTDVVNVQVEGTPTNVSVKLRVNRTNVTAVALLGLTILSVPASVGAQWVHCSAAES